MGFLCPRCGREVKSALDVVLLRLEAIRQIPGKAAPQRYKTVRLGEVCRSCADDEIEKRRPGKRLEPEPLRLEGL
jgi:hypothetical protein